MKNKESYEKAAGMGLDNTFFTFNNIDPDAECDLFWICKYCGENETPKCHKCVREDGKIVSDELSD